MGAMKAPAARIDRDSAPDPAFRAIYQAHFRHVWHTLRRLGVPDRDLEDLAHDVFIVAHAKMEAFDADRSMRAWLSGIAWRVASDHRRRARSRLEVVGHAREPASGERGPDQELELARARARVHRALDALPEEQRIVFIMKEIDGFSMPEIQTALDVPLNTLYSRLRLARGRFRQEIELQDGAGGPG